MHIVYMYEKLVREHIYKKGDFWNVSYVDLDERDLKTLNIEPV
jgi:hypothetical protein